MKKHKLLTNRNESRHPRSHENLIQDLAAFHGSLHDDLIKALNISTPGESDMYHPCNAIKQKSNHSHFFKLFTSPQRKKRNGGCGNFLPVWAMNSIRVSLTQSRNDQREWEGVFAAFKLLFFLDWFVGFYHLFSLYI